MTKEKSNPQSPEEMAKTAQEAAVKSAMEQAQAMFGNIPGFQMPGGMQEQIMTQMGSGVLRSRMPFHCQQAHHAIHHVP